MNKSKISEVFEMLKKKVDETGMVDVGNGAHLKLGCSNSELMYALMDLELAGYPTYGCEMYNEFKENSLLRFRILCPPGTKHRDIFAFVEGQKA